MEQFDQRAYQRGNHFAYDAKASRDARVWKRVQVGDISSGGLKLYGSEEYDEGDVLWLDVLVHGFMSEFTLQVQGQVRHKTILSEDRFQYGIAFVGLSQDDKIRIDENVRNDRPITGEGYHPE